jgi:hypothetical protein
LILIGHCGGGLRWFLGGSLATPNFFTISIKIIFSILGPDNVNFVVYIEKEIVKYFTIKTIMNELYSMKDHHRA